MDGREWRPAFVVVHNLRNARLPRPGAHSIRRSRQSRRPLDPRLPAIRAERFAHAVPRRAAVRALREDPRRGEGADKTEHVEGLHRARLARTCHQIARAQSAVQARERLPGAGRNQGTSFLRRVRLARVFQLPHAVHDRSGDFRNAGHVERRPGPSTHGKRLSFGKRG